MKTILTATARKMNSDLTAAGRAQKWELDTDACSNSAGTWFCGVLGGVSDAQSMRTETRRLIALPRK